MSFEVGERIRIPSPIDVHTHLREPGGTDKETIASGTFAALAGGYQAVFDMPNNPGGMQTWSEDRLDQKHKTGEATANTHIGFYAGVDLGEPNVDEIPRMIGKSAGLKLYFGHTTGTTKEFVLDDARETIDEWVSQGVAMQNGNHPPILLHAREGVGEEVARYIARKNWPVHWCHVSTVTETAMAEDLRESFGGNFTAGVTPHHLTMTDRDADKYGWMGGRMMPPLGKEIDGDALLDAFANGRLQILETDHAPHTDADKMKAERENPEGHSEVDCTTCFGISGIEFVLPVMMSFVQRRKISMERLVDALHYQPAQMLGLDVSNNSTFTELKIGPRVIEEKDRVGKSVNNPYVGWLAWAQVEYVDFDGSKRYRSSAYPPEFQPRILNTGSIL